MSWRNLKGYNTTDRGGVVLSTPDPGAGFSAFGRETGAMFYPTYSYTSVQKAVNSEWDLTNFYVALNGRYRQLRSGDVIFNIPGTNYRVDYLKTADDTTIDLRVMGVGKYIEDVSQEYGIPLVKCYVVGVIFYPYGNYVNVIPAGGIEATDDILIAYANGFIADTFSKAKGRKLSGRATAKLNGRWAGFGSGGIGILPDALMRQIRDATSGEYPYIHRSTISAGASTIGWSRYGFYLSDYSTCFELSFAPYIISTPSTQITQNFAYSQWIKGTPTEIDKNSIYMGVSSMMFSVEDIT